MNIYFLRHGETVENSKKTFFGSLDSELSLSGYSQCIKARQSLMNIDFDKVFISEKRRTKQTADIVLAGKKKSMIIDSRINEIDFGIFEGKTYKEIEELYPVEAKCWMDNWKEFCPREGESFIDFYSRVADFMEDIKKLEEENILVVTHGGVIRAAFAYVLGGDMNNYWRISCKTGDISVIKYEYDNFYIDSITHIGGID